jgi:ankyrin repeat protein
MCIKKDPTAAINMLFEKCPHFDINVVDNFGRTPFLLAARYGCIKAMIELTRRNAEIQLFR